MPRFAVPLVLIALATPLAAAQTDAKLAAAQTDAKLDRALAGLSAGTPEKCVKRYRVNGVRGYEGTLLFETGRRSYYRNTVEGGCNGLARGDIPVITARHSDEYCEGDTVQTRAPSGGSFTSFCTLGPFVPYSVAK